MNIRDGQARMERALYLAKQFGRDRVEVLETPSSSVASAEIVPLTPRPSPRRN